LTNKNVKKRDNNLSPIGGYSLLELIITLGVLAILVMGTIPLAQNAVKRDKEMKLRENSASGSKCGRRV